MQFSFRKPHFWHPPNFAKTLFWHTVALLVFLKMPPKHYKNGEKQWKNNLDHFLTLNLDHFLTLKPPNLGPLFNFTAYIYIYVFLLKDAFSYRGKCIFLQSFLCRENDSSLQGAHCQKLQEIAGGPQAQESRTLANFQKTQGGRGCPRFLDAALAGPPGPKCRKSLEMYLRASGPGTPKSPTLQKHSADTFRRLFRRLARLSWRLFWGALGPRAPGDIFETFSAFRAQRARETTSSPIFRQHDKWRNAIPAKVWALSGKENGCLKSAPPFWKRGKGPPHPHTFSLAKKRKLWSACPPRRPENQKQLKWRKSDSKVTLRGRPQSDSRMTQNAWKSHFWVTLGPTPQSHFWVTLIVFGFRAF